MCTQRLRIRRAREDDAYELALLMSGTISARLASWPAEMTPAMARDRLSRDLANAGAIAPMVMELREGGRICGWMSVARLPEHPSCAILTYWLGEAHHGQGLMREVAASAVRRLFETLDLDRLRAAVQADNPASIGVLRGAGMHYLGAGRIWCSARRREEQCLWFEIDRTMALGETAAIGHSQAGAGVPER
ncbi:MAG: hypothetical protein JWO26_3025 [Rhodospirillales bacterium]|nr:hypothetical protein [Rhodospirillales bacterium]